MDKKVFMVFKWVALFLYMPIVCAQQIYTNGPIATGTLASDNTPAPAGYAWSELQAPNTTYGTSVMYRNVIAIDYAIADDFVVPAGQVWNIASADFYCYQTGYTGTVPPIDAIRVRIWNGDPSLGTSTIVYGDMVTNVFNAANSADALVYRGNIPMTTLRKVWKINANVTVSLPAGTYWIEHQLHDIGDLNLFSPPVTILNTLSDASWNAKQRDNTMWSDIIDTGTNTQRALPFVLNGNVLGIDSYDLSDGIILFPNPASAIITIAGKTFDLDGKLEIFDITGRLIKQFTTNHTDSLTVDVSGLKAGNYLLRLTIDNGIITKKFVKI